MTIDGFTIHRARDLIGSIHEPQAMVIATENQFNIRIADVSSGIADVKYRLLVEEKAIREDRKAMSLDSRDIEFLTHASDEALSRWATDHNLLVTKVDYVANTVFRSHPYTTFIADLTEKQRAILEGSLDAIDPSALDGIEELTRGEYWKKIDELAARLSDAPSGLSEGERRDYCKESYEHIAYVAIKALKEGQLKDLDEVARILIYCGYCIERPYVSRLTGDDFKTGFFDLFTFTVGPQYRPLTKKAEDDFMRDLPIEDQLIIDLPDSFAGLFSTSSSDRLTFYNGGSCAAKCRPVAGTSHRNRFASALDRPVAVYVPRITPPEEIHSYSCNSWSNATSHDLLHLLIESGISSREQLIALAWSAYIRLGEGQSSADIYNLLLDRISTELLMLNPERLPEELSEEQREGISDATKSIFSEHIRAWYDKHVEKFHIVSSKES